VWNVLDLPSVALPVGFVDQELDTPDTDDYKARSEIDAKVQAMYTGPQRFKDAPLGLQLVGRRWREEELLAFAGVIDDAVHARG
jgi:amidase